MTDLNEAERLDAARERAERLRRERLGEAS
jgi:hypothetical protein